MSKVRRKHKHNYNHTLLIVGLAAGLTAIGYFVIPGLADAIKGGMGGGTSPTPLPGAGQPHSAVLPNNPGAKQYFTFADHDNSGLDFSDKFTIEAWVKLSSSASGKNAIVSKNDPTEKNHAYNFYWQDDVLVVEMMADGGKSSGKHIYANYRPYVLPRDQWVHLAIVFDFAVKFYANGVEIVRPRDVPHTQFGNIENNNKNLSIGADKSGAEGFFDGQLDEVRMWNIAKTPQEIQENYLKELTGSEPGLVGYWKFNAELVDGKAKDDSSRGNHLQLVNKPQFSTDAPF